MTTAQQPIDSGFGRDTTALEAIQGIDLTGKLAVVTGGYSGLGLETTRALLAAGAQVLVPARRVEHAKQELASLGDQSASAEVAELDLSNLSSVSAFCEAFNDSGRSIDILINNAAVMACPETRVTNNWEIQFATNHLGHYVMTNLLYPALAADGGARVVSLSSTGHKLSPIRWEDPMFEHEDYHKWTAYGQAKTANSLFAVQLDQLGETDGVRTFAVHPGGIMTPLQRHLPREEMIQFGWIDEEGNVNEIFKSPEQGASTTIWAATSPALSGMGGVYCEDCNIAAPTELDSPTARYQGINEHAIDRESAHRLWAMSESLTGINQFA
ncbi:MAG: SDR family NAD(P)-dependent oxidoreductase [Pseudomonadota bacterium]